MFSTYYNMILRRGLNGGMILFGHKIGKQNSFFFGLQFFSFAFLKLKFVDLTFLANLLLLWQWNKEQKKGKIGFFAKKKMFLLLFTSHSLSQSNILFNFLALLWEMYKCCTLHKVEKFWQTNTDAQTLSFHQLV